MSTGKFLISVSLVALFAFASASSLALFRLRIRQKARMEKERREKDGPIKTRARVANSLGIFLWEKENASPDEDRKEAEEEGWKFLICLRDEEPEQFFKKIIRAAKDELHFLSQDEILKHILEFRVTHASTSNQSVFVFYRKREGYI